MESTTPSLPLAKAQYLRDGMQRVNGWLNPSTAVYLSGLEVLQRAIPVTGDVCEIGIHHGKSFMCFALGLPSDQTAVAIDVFEDYASNVDGSGRGDRQAFEENLAEHGAGGNINVIQASSLQLDQLGFLDAGRRFRVFSIDGGHTAEATHNDLQVAEATVVDRAVVVLDDVLNRHWLGVITGLFRYWSKGGTLVPAVVVPNKLLLASSAEQASAYRRLMAEHFRAGLEKSDVPLGDHVVDVYGEFPWIVRDEAGGTALLGGGPRPATTSAPTRAVPAGYVEDLERRLRAHEVPLRRKVVRRLRRLTGRSANSRREGVSPRVR